MTGIDFVELRDKIIANWNKDIGYLSAEEIDKRFKKKDFIATERDIHELIDSALRVGFEAGKKEAELLLIGIPEARDERVKRETAEKIFAELEFAMVNPIGHKIEFDVKDYEEIESRFVEKSKEVNL